MQVSTFLKRFYWSCMYIFLISFIAFITINLWNTFQTNPTVTTLISSTYPVNQVPFPGVSICNINKISKKRAHNMTSKLANITGRNSIEMMKYMSFVGHLYDFDYDPALVTQLLEFQNMLDVLGISVIDLTRKIATPCDELLKSCSWKNMEVNCSSLFFTRVTHDGYCCLFNYVKQTGEMQNISTEPVTTEAGVENGLYVSVNNDLEDFYYTTISAPGLMIQIFVPTDYPDKPSGSVNEILTHPSSENFIEIIPTTLKSAAEVSSYPIAKRDCLLLHEESTVFKGVYSASDCNVNCRILSIQAMCQCIPFMFPFSDNNTVCTLADVPCLNRYRDKWLSLYPDGNLNSLLAKEKQDSLRCDKKCYQPCGLTIYEVHSNSFPIFNKTEKGENTTHIYVYYLHRFSNMYLQDVVYYWFELLSNFGGILGIFVGWNIIVIMLNIYYYSKRFIQVYFLK